MTQPAIIAENLTCQYGKLLAVDHINFDAGWGDVARNLVMLLVFAAACMTLGVVLLKRRFR
jgi:hypothetical protein